MPASLPPELNGLLSDGAQRGPLVALSGAGISAESGVPTFRGEEGYWTVGSHNYRPEQLATRAAFEAMPAEIWAWYAHRRGVCARAEPNAGHRALVEIETAAGDDFLLITQNVDGLHPRAGSTRERCFEIHGSLTRARCADACGAPLRPFPDLDVDWPRDRALAREETARLHCTRCGGWLRPHVLWFDECYDEEHYRFDSSLRAAQDAGVLLVVGTSGSTNLPTQVCQLAAARGAALVAVNRDPSPFTELAAGYERGFFAQGQAGDWLPRIAQAWIDAQP